MAIGAFGSFVFTTSDSRILTFRDFTHTTAARFTDHEVIGAKPKTEYIGPGLDDVTFSITLRSDMGLNVRKELEKWQRAARTGRAERLVIGRSRLGSDRWVITSCSEAWNLITNRGVLLSASLDISLKEYISR